MLISKMAVANTAIFSLQNNTPLNPNKSTLVFIHGSPGDHKTFKKYLNDQSLEQKFNLILIDRPGYGKSQKFKRQIRMTEQASLIQDHLNMNLALDKLPSRKYIISHSYGSPLSVLVASNLGYIDGLVLMAGPYNPNFNMVRWYNSVGKWYLIKAMIGKFWITSNEEMLPINKDLAFVEKALENYQGQTHFLHGSKDGIVPIKHSRWAHQLRLENEKLSQFVEFTSNHFFIWTKFRMIKDYILSLDEH